MVPRDLRDSIVALAGEGMSRRAIAGDLGTTMATVRRVVAAWRARAVA